MSRTVIDPSLTPAAQGNIIDNGGFEIWQRGAGPFTNFTGYFADRWNISTSCTAYSAAKETGASNIDSGVSSCKLVITTAAGGVFRIGQSVENDSQYVGKVMTFSARVKSNIAGVKMLVSYSGGQTAGAVGHTGGNTFETLSVTLTIPATGLTFSIGFDSVNTTVGTSVSPSAGTFYVDSVALVYGSNVSPFISLPFQIDLARCQRFYYRICGNTNDEYVGVGQFTTASAFYTIVRHPVFMRISPTMTVVNSSGFRVFTQNGTETTVTGGITPSSGTITSTRIDVGVSATGVAGNAGLMRSQATSSYIEVSADF